MGKHHFSAGYELKSVKDLISKGNLDQDDKIRYEGLKNSLSSFIVKSDVDLDEIPINRDNRFAYVLHNMIIRGIPTLAPFDLEENIRNTTNAISFRESKTQSLEHEIIKGKVSKDLLFRAFHIIEPRIDRNTAYENYLMSWEDHGSEFEERYLYRELPSRTFHGRGDFIIQLFQPQRSISTLLREERGMELKGNNFAEQKVDFALEYPYPVTINRRKGFCVEIDGSQHEAHQQQYLDGRRDDAVLEFGWSNTVRLKTRDFNHTGLTQHFGILNDREFSKDLFLIYHKNYIDPLYKSDQGLLAMELVLTPYLVSRIQFTLIKAIISGIISFEEEKWKIAVLERDLPCARLAMNDLRRFLDAFSRLENKSRKFPEIELDVFYTPEFQKSSFRTKEDRSISEIGNVKKQYDIYIDISILERDGLSRRNESVVYDTYFQIRSAFHSFNENTSFLTSKRITWGNLVLPDGDDKWKDHPLTSNALEFFIQNLFRKKTFREGQLRILDRALRNQTVIGLLPTGGGKSLTYQLAGILQPGHVIVIDPIKSLMKDQVDSLAKIGITATIFINSSLKDVQSRQNAQNKLSKGRALFCFISPERLMIEKFRLSLASMANDNHFFSYGVIDEVHCVSEWGHNFRTPYLSLGRNLLDFCKAADGKIALFGLTATASYDVLSDVQRELSGNNDSQMIPDEAIVRHENTNRDELQYHIEKVELTDSEIQDIQKNARGSYFELRLNETFGRLKQNIINQLLRNPGSIIRKFNKNINQVINEELILLTYPEGYYPNPEEIHNRIKITSNSYEEGFWNYVDEEGNNNAALVFAPHKTWYFGVTDSYRSDDRRVGITESIMRANILSSQKIGTFMGVDSDDDATANRLQEDNDSNQEAFIEGRQQLMVATKAFGMGIDKPNIRITIHNNFPDSIESFVQEAGRGGRDRKLSVACILYNDQEIEDPSKDKTYKHDLDLQESFYWNSFKGENHEKWVLFELLNEIIFPGRDRINQLSRILNEHPDILDMGFRVWLNHHQPSNRLYINAPNNQNFGFLNYTNGYLTTDNATVGQEDSTKALNALWSIISDLAIDIAPQLRQSWIMENQGSEKKPGIEKVLETIQFGQNFEILVPFNNDHSDIYENLAHFILEFKGMAINNNAVTEYAAYCKKYYHVQMEKFFEGMDRNTGILQIIDVNNIDNLEKTKNFKQRVQTQLHKKRDKQDTEKAIFRFSVIGLIDDYTVDYNSETYILKGRKKYKEEYHQALRFYISKYYSQKRTDNIINTLNKRKGNTEIQRILNFITEFVYKEVAKKRHESITFMQDCCKIGLERGNIEMKTWIHLYFNSKYARKGYTVKIEEDKLLYFSNLPLMEVGSGDYNASLLDWTNEGQEEEFDYIIDFMHLMEYDEINSERDNLKHLRGACTRLIMANPDNYVFRLLRAFAVLLVEETNLKQNIKNVVIDDLKKGYINLFEREGNDFDIDEALMEYKAVMLDKLQNDNAKAWFLEVMEDLEFLAHAAWTEKFKEKFTKDLIL